jgi:23S rRNA (adenine2503-C2)-methyltransferase
MSTLAEPLAELDDRAGRVSLAGAARSELAAALAEAGVPEREIRMRVAQLWHWIYHAGATSFAASDTLRWGSCWGVDAFPD